MFLLTMSLVTVLSGCAAEVPEVFTFDAERYPAVAKSVTAAMREERFIVDRNDPRLGVFTSKPLTSPTILEFFKADNSTMAQAWESTANLQRRRVRVVIEPEKEKEGEYDAEQLANMSQVTLNPPPPTFEHPSGPLNLRVMVFVDRAHQPLWQVETTTRRLSSHAIDPQLRERRMQPLYWEPISRDPFMEQRLMRRIIRHMNEATREQTDKPSGKDVPAQTQQDTDPVVETGV